ncbi:MAG: hypothetical protein MUC46_07330, partial [Desulfobacterales bacterium]|nr:hypothetical protein [Desulfobacterales bacterium]
MEFFDSLHNAGIAESLGEDTRAARGAKRGPKRGSANGCRVDAVYSLSWVRMDLRQFGEKHLAGKVKIPKSKAGLQRPL